MEQALRLISPATAAPAHRSLTDAAIERQRHGDAAGAAVLYQRHLKRHPDDAGSWMSLGSVLRRLERRDSALVSYQRALRLQPRSASAWSAMGSLWLELGQVEQALRAHRRALELDPARLQLRAGCVHALIAASRFAEAEQMLDDCIRLEPGRADLRWLRAQVRLLTGRLREAWADYDARWECGASLLPVVPASRWRGECIGGKHLLLLGESSLSETLWAARYIPMLASRGAAIELAAPEAMHPVLAALGVTLRSHAAVVQPRQRLDFQCPLLGLPALVDTRGVSIPEALRVTVADPVRDRMARWTTPYRSAFRIGICWSGSVRSGRHQCEAVALQRFLPLAALPGVQLFSLQKGRPAGELQSTGAAGFIADLGKRCEDLGDTAAAIDAMDLVVTTDGVVAHLAACMGKPVLNLLAHRPYWIYGLRGTSTPWYPTMRLIRQNAPGDWDSVFREAQQLVGGWAEVRMRERHGTQ